MSLAKKKPRFKSLPRGQTIDPLPREKWPNVAPKDQIFLGEALYAVGEQIYGVDWTEADLSASPPEALYETNGLSLLNPIELPEEFETAGRLDIESVAEAIEKLKALFPDPDEKEDSEEIPRSEFDILGLLSFDDLRVLSQKEFNDFQREVDHSTWKRIILKLRERWNKDAAAWGRFNTVCTKLQRSFIDGSIETKYRDDTIKFEKIHPDEWAHDDLIARFRTCTFSPEYPLGFTVRYFPEAEVYVPSGYFIFLNRLQFQNFCCGLERRRGNPANRKMMVADVKVWLWKTYSDGGQLWKIKAEYLEGAKTAFAGANFKFSNRLFDEAWGQAMKEYPRMREQLGKAGRRPVKRPV